MRDLAFIYPTLSLSTPPAIEPVTVEEGLAFFQYEGTDAASAATALSALKTARIKVERDAAIALITQGRQIRLDSFPPCELELRIAPIQAVASVQYRDGNNVLQTLAADQYQADTHSRPGRIAPAPGVCWPATPCGVMNAVTITLTVGYGPAASDVPEDAKFAIKLLAREWFWGRCASGEVGERIGSAYASLITGLSWRPQV